MSSRVWASAAIGLLLLISVLLRDELLLFISLVLSLGAVVSFLWDRYSLKGIEYHREFSQTRVFFGEEIELTVEVVNRKLLPLAWLQIEDEIPGNLVPQKASVSQSIKFSRSLLTNVFSLRPYERVRRRYRLRCETRGYHTFGPANCRSGDIFGYYEKESSFPGEDHLIVYPKIFPISQLGLSPKNPFGDFKLRQWIFQDPSRLVGVREYERGDSPRSIHWKATARTQQLQVKLYEPTASYHLVVFLNLHTSGPFWWFQGYDPNFLELAISTTASVANWAIEQGNRVGICANGPERWSIGTVHIAPSRDPEQMTHILETLARALPFATMSFDALLRLESSRLPYGSTVVVVTAMLEEEVVAELLALKAAGHRLAIILVGDCAPDIKADGILIHKVSDSGSSADIPESVGLKP